MIFEQEIFNKNLDDIFDYFDNLVESAQMWASALSPQIESKVTTSHGGNFALKEDDDLKARMATFSRMQKVNEVSSVPPLEQECKIYALKGHSTGNQEFPTILAFKEVQYQCDLICQQAIFQSLL